MANPRVETLKLQVPGAALEVRCHWADDTPRPIVLLRTPYGAHHHDGEAQHWHKLGFHFVSSDVRGRYASTGVFEPYTHERSDGECVARHIMTDPRCNGQIVAYGASYAAHCAVELAHRVPLLGIIALVPSLSLGCAANDGEGIYRLLSHTWWWHRHAYARQPRDISTAQLLANNAQLLRVELKDIPQNIGVQVPGWAEVWEAPHTWEIPPAAQNLPLLICSGFNDAYLEDTTRFAQEWPGPSWCYIGQCNHNFRDSDGARCRWIGRILQEWARAVRNESPPEEVGTRYFLEDQDGGWHSPRTPGLDNQPVELLVQAKNPLLIRPSTELFPSWQIGELGSYKERLTHPGQCFAQIHWPEGEPEGLLCGELKVRCRVDFSEDVMPTLTTFAHLMCIEDNQVRWVASTSLNHGVGEIELRFPAVCARITPQQTWIIQWSSSDFPVHYVAREQNNHLERRITQIKIRAQYEGRKGVREKE